MCLKLFDLTGGIHAISYTYTSSACPVTVTKNIEVINCSDTSTVNIRDGVWHYLTAVKNGTNATIYLDGQTVAGLPVQNVGTFTGTAINFHIADWIGGGTLPRFWKGRIDEFKVWGNVLSQSQIGDAMLCSADPGNANLLVHFPFDQGLDAGNNSTVTSAFNDGAGNDGALSGFALNGNTSNWVARGRDILPRCTVAPFAYREGNSGENIPEHAKVYDGDIFTSGVEIINNENFPSFSRRRADGSIVWRTRINVKSYISDFIRTDEGCYLLVGNTPNFTSNSKSFIARIDQTGVLDFHHVYNLGNRESFSRIIRSTNPSNPLFPYTVSGINNNSGVLDENILLFTVDNQGAIGWMRQIGYTGTNLTDGRTDLTNGFGNPDIGAVMYNFEMDPDSCPVMREVPNVKDFTLVPTDLSTLPNIFLTPPPPQISNPWIHYTLGRDSICKSDCACSFSKMSFSKKGTTWHPSVSCGNLPPIPVLCPGQYAYNALKFSGNLNCEGSCSFTSLSWTIKNPNNVIVSTGSSSSAVFLISITLPMVQTPGVYTIQLTGKCGTNVCECTIKFQVGDCPKPCDCNEPGFSNAVNTGFYWTIMSDCKVKFTPKSLTDCDAFLWQVAKSGSTNFVTFANSTANQPVIYQFPNSGQYVICIMVTRTAQPGVTCTAARCWTYDADCSMLFVTPNSNEGDFEGSCQGSVVENDGFTLGAEAGGLADVGTAWKWDFSTGNPEIVLEAGKSDSNLVRLRGNGGFADLLYQDSLPMLGAKRLKLSIGFRPIPGLVLPGTELVVRISTKKQDSLLCDNPNTCLELLRLPISETDTLPDWSVTGSYDSTTFAGRYLSIHVENPFFDDDLGFMSVVDIDNICLIPYNFISVKDLAKAEIDVRLFPNPSTGQLVVEWHGADLKSASVQIVGPLGQTLRTLPVSSGATRLETQVSDLPSGIYFVKVLTEHRLVKVLKFVKQ